MRCNNLEARPALEMEGRGFLLVELGLAVRDLRQGHREVARLEEDLDVASQVLVAVEDVLEVEARDGGDEEVGWLGLVGEAPNAVVAGPVVARSGVVADHRREVADPEGVVGHGVSPNDGIILVDPDRVAPP